MLETLDSCWEEMYVGVNRYDREIWPTSEPVNRAVLFVTDEHNNSTTYEHLPEMRRARPMIDLDVTCDNRQHRTMDWLISKLNGVSRTAASASSFTKALATKQGQGTDWAAADFELESKSTSYGTGPWGSCRTTMTKS